MTPERYQCILDLFHRATDVAENERHAFLVRESGGDEELLQSVEQMLAADERGQTFLETPPADLAAALVEQRALDLRAGQMVEQYKIVDRLGQGGMGVVYRAMDTRLNRLVALKLLSSEVADPAARRRFQREARVASSLNHPHILTVFDAGEIADHPYLVTELVDGGTLESWLASEKRKWRQVVELLIGVADGLATAHAASILHRDVKPANIFVTSSGYAKLADFGLAKLIKPSESVATRGDCITRPGGIIGTVAYMSPEQGSGAPVDARSDVFSFGLVLYEALARRRAFAGSTELELLNEIVHSLPAPLPDDLPLGVRMVIEKALEKNPADRYQTMRDLVVDLRRATRVEMLGRPILATKAKRNAFSPIPVAAVAIAAVGTVTGWWLHARFSSMQPQRTVGIQRLTDTVGLEETPAISPDGKAIAFISVVAGKRQIWIRLLASGAPRAITKDDVDHYEPRGRPIRRR